MPILYSAIFKGSVTAAQFSNIDGNFNAVAKEFLAKGQIGRNDGKFTYNVEGTTFNFLTKTGISKQAAA
jgi:vesicle-associated membrane protein 72